MDYEKSKIIRFFLLVLFPTSVFSFVTFGVWLVYLLIVYFTCGILYRLVHLLFSRIILPFYLLWLTRGDKFLIRFDEHELPDITQRRQRWNHAGKMSRTAVFLLIFLIAMMAQSKIESASTGEGIDAYRCPDGTVELYANNCDLVDDSDSYPVCTDGCEIELSARDKTWETFVGFNTINVLIFAPYITVIVAPLIVMKYSALAVVDPKKKSIAPIGSKLTDVVNAAMGFGALVIFGKVLYSVSQSAATSEESISGLMISTSFIVAVMIWFIYPTIWLANAKFAKSHPKLVRNLDSRITRKSNLNVHRLEHNREGLNISSVSSQALRETP